MDISIPSDAPKPNFPDSSYYPRTSHQFFGSGTMPSAFIDRPDIGAFVSRIIDDPRTLNQYVFCYGDHLTLTELWDTARAVKLEVTGEELKATPKRVSEEEIVDGARNGEGAVKHTMEYMLSVYVRGDNTVQNAVKPEYGGALDGRELYPDLKVKSFREFAKWWYSEN